MLEEINDLPRKVVENLDGDQGNIKVYLVQDFNLSLLRRIVNFELDIFNEQGIDEWGLVPQIRHGNVFILKEENKKKIIGIAILMRDWEEFDKAYLFDFAIADEYQGQSLGYHFLHSICINIREQGFNKMDLTVNTENPGAIHLYKDKLGFKTIKMSEDEFGKGHHRYVMELDLVTLKKLN
ncbi:acetyltransferase [Desulfosporosinus orientis DSM 765]|uniref:Acetyltransferase n=1 Tax=Desulfosporosinus orientis (strain ATCC 19365 / DSM 765 / NCIMB 8382 / VKM B-1628 / Singapore I) TaxID=768706 RepID=G7W905_DESOD|nr:GNAT family N-acetyltransferase [Desulfosporosinus orientis]AET68214.1 acetyltransferase [Desulfosporosinus orientis DSM 765]